MSFSRTRSCRSVVRKSARHATGTTTPPCTEITGCSQSAIVSKSTVVSNGCEAYLASVCWIKSGWKDSRTGGEPGGGLTGLSVESSTPITRKPAFWLRRANVALTSLAIPCGSRGSNHDFNSTANDSRGRSNSDCRHRKPLTMQNHSSSGRFKHDESGARVAALEARDVRASLAAGSASWTNSAQVPAGCGASAHFARCNNIASSREVDGLKPSR